MTEQSPPVRYELRAGAAVLTLDTPHNRNAISAALLRGLHEGLQRAAADDGARAVILAHTGNTFCAGADLAEAGNPESSAREQAAARTRAFIAMLQAMVDLPKPLIAEVDGHVRAGGMGLVAACDFAFAGPQSSFALTEVRLGLAAAMVSVPILARVSDRAAARTFLTGSTFDAAQAAEIGLISAAVPEPGAAVEELLGELRACSPQGLAATKSLLSAELSATLREHGEDLAQLSAELFDSPESTEGMTAFFEKRPPSWAVGAP